MAFVTIIVMLSLIEYCYFGAAVAQARGRHFVKAPATAGDETFERFYRAHHNTLEQLVVFIPAIYATGYYVNELARTPDGWKLRAITLNVTWSSGNPDVPRIALRRGRAASEG